jgi:transcriptional regulator of acetoin/glycerol metabolism
VLQLGDLPTQLKEQGLEAGRSAAANKVAGETGVAARVKKLADQERDSILDAIRILNGDKLQAAKLLGIGKTTLYRKLKEYGIPDQLREE